MKRRIIRFLKFLVCMLVICIAPILIYVLVDTARIYWHCRPQADSVLCENS